ncbi:MAG: hemerythrin domain-containing protein [Flavobacteriaceae bacterium]
MSDIPRKPLSEDLRFLVRKYPRETWTGHENLGQTGAFWLQRHNMFRELGASIREATGDFREQKTEANEFLQWMAPRLQFFLSQLEGHHHVEDLHYFPVFRAAEVRLGKGFDILDNDHEWLDGNLHTTAEVANAMIRALQAGSDAEAAIQAYADQVDRLNAAMLSHLRDEEDLIIPLILDRTEAKLGIA